MRQQSTTTTTASATTEKIDPLMRIQEEIKEVKRREQEYRQLKFGDYDEQDSDDNALNNNNINTNHDNDNNEHFSMSPEPPAAQIATVTLLSVPDDSSLASSVNSKESLDEQHSDDSGISASSSPVNGTSANDSKPANAHGIKEQRYIGPNTYNLTPVPPPQKLLTRTVSTPQIFTQNRIIAHSPAQKGLMQRFIASRGKIVLNNNNNNNIGAGSNKLSFGSNINPYNNNNSLSNGNITVTATPPNTPATAAINTVMMPEFGLRSASSIIIPTVTMTPPVIERDADGKPIRRGYIPVEVKIQRELKDYKSRESELKKYRKIRDSTPDLLDSIDMENMESEEDDSDTEHCYGPGKLRSAKSIGELCDSAHSNNSISPRTTPSPDFEHKLHFSRGSGMRPAMSLAQLCDLTPEEAPSSHRLIAQWESIIKKNEPKSERE